MAKWQSGVVALCTEMTLDEINEEIRLAREERAAHEACLNGRARGSSTKLESLVTLFFDVNNLFSLGSTTANVSAVLIFFLNIPKGYFVFAY